MYKNLMRIVVMLAAVVATGDTFAQARGLRRPGLFNRNAAQQPAAAAPAPAAAAPAQGESSSENSVSDLQADGAAVELIVQMYGKLVGKTIIVDPAVKGQMNDTIKFKSAPGQKLTDEDYILLYETLLEMHQVHLEPYGEKFIRALPRKDVRKEGIPLIMDSDTGLGDTSRVVSMMVQLKNISTEDGQKTLDNFKSASGILIGFERTNSILITDTEANINRMLEIIRAIDVAVPNLDEVYVRQIKYTTAADIKTVLEAVVQESQKEQEKSGAKNTATLNQNSAAQQRPFGSRLLNGGKPAQPAAPVSNNSLVMAVSDADRGMIRGRVTIVSDDYSNKLLIITRKENMDQFDRIIAALDIETTPDIEVKVYRLKYAEAEEVSDMINDLIGNSSGSKSGKDSKNRNASQGSNSNLTRSNTAQNANRGPANQRSGEAKTGELTKDNTTVLADKRINGLVVMTEKELVPTIEGIIEKMDVKLSQVLIETVIIEVALGDGIETGMDWVQKGRLQNNPNAGQNMYYMRRTATTTDEDGNTTTTSSLLGNLVPSGFSSERTVTDGNTTTKFVDSASEVIGQAAGFAQSGLANYYTAGMASGIGGGANNGALAYSIAQGISSNVLGRAFNFIFDSDKLGLTAILQATKTDSHSKYIASPIIMTLDNKEATIEATQMRYLFKGYQYSGSSMYGSAVPDYEQKELGITIKVTPKINPNGTVMLTLEEEYSQEGADQPITGQDGKPFNAATTVTRKMSADALLENNQTVIFAGLTETSKSESESGIPILKDIPWIGKWLFGSVKQQEQRTELLVFMTPYVLDDAAAAEAEAIRRKRALSDAHAWDDHGWSASKLAEPVSKKEQLRRLQDEWKKQDEERRAKIAIEQEKVKRVKALEKLSKEERKIWLEMHKDELEEEEQEELEKKMLDEDSQKELKKIADDYKARKLEEAEQTIKESEKETAQENEYSRLARERAEKAAKNGQAESQEPAEKAAEAATSNASETEDKDEKESTAEQ